MAFNYMRIESKSYKNFIGELKRILDGMQIFRPEWGVIQSISKFLDEHKRPTDDSKVKELKNFESLLHIDKDTMRYMPDDMRNSISRGTRSVIVLMVAKLEDFVFEQVKEVFFTFREDYTLPLVKKSLEAELKELNLNEMRNLRNQITELRTGQNTIDASSRQKIELQSERENQEKQSAELKRKLMKKEIRFNRLFAPFLNAGCSESDIPRHLEMLSFVTAERIKQAAKESYIREVNYSLEGSFTNIWDKGQILLQEAFKSSYNLNEEYQKELIENFAAEIDSKNKFEDKQSRGLQIQIPLSEESNSTDYCTYLVIPNDWETFNYLCRFYYGIRCLFAQWDWEPTLNGPLRGDPKFSFKVIRKFNRADKTSNLEFNGKKASEEVSRYMEIQWTRAKEMEGVLCEDYHLFCNAKAAVRMLAIIFMKFSQKYIEQIRSTA